MKPLKSTCLILWILLLSPLAAIASTDEEEVGYDTLVKELTTQYDDDDRDLLSNVQIHLGAAATSSMFVVQPKIGSTIYASQRAVQASVAIDLFSSHWIAEGAFQNYIDRQYDSYQVRLKGFDLKVIYRNRMDGTLGYHIGGGLAARYLTLQNADGEEAYTTPFSAVVGGLDTYLTRSFSLGLEVAARNTLTYETPDQSALDLTLRFDGHF
jgi:hypothetical protein